MASRKKQQREPSKYDGFNIKELVGRARTNLIEAVGILFYLKHTSRYKEDSEYQGSSFSGWLKNNFGMNEHTLTELDIAIQACPEESVKYGPAVVHRVLRQTGDKNAAKSFFDKQVRTFEAETKKPKATAGEVERILNKVHPAPKPAPSLGGRLSYVELQRECDDWRKRAVQAEADNKVLAEQVSKFKASVTKYKEENAKLQHRISELGTALTPMDKVMRSIMPFINGTAPVQREIAPPVH